MTKNDFERKIKDDQIDLITIENFYDHLNKGLIRCANNVNNKWIINKWVIDGIIKSFKFKENKIINNTVYDKFERLNQNWNEFDYKKKQLRVTSNGLIREGVYIGRNVIIMPSFINVGSYIGDNTMIDTWASIGSGAQIGKNCHISGGVGIGGILEPLQYSPVIIEDNCFIGSRSCIVEGVIIGEGSVIGTNVNLSNSTKIYDRNTKKITYGYIPPYSVVVSGSIPGDKNKDINLYCAVIVKQVDKNTRLKTKINELLRY